MSSLPPLSVMLNDLISRPSVSSTVAGLDQSNRAVIERLADWCERIGMRVELMVVDAATDKWNLLATTGPGKGGLVLAGHSDTVPFDERAWSSDPFSLREASQCWYGLGICDMKGFFPLALQVIEEAQEHLQKPLTLLATADEESAMTGARLLQQRGDRLGDYVLIGEPTGLQPVHQHKGIMMEEIVVEGRSGHSSQPSLGRSALEAMTDVILALRSLRVDWYGKYHNPGFSVPTPTLNLGCIHGGDNPNRICRQCQLQFDVRLMPGMQIEETRAAIRSCLQPIAVAHDVSIGLQTLFDGVSSFEQDINSEWVKMCEIASGRSSGSVAFATEAPFFKALGAETVVLGPGNIDQAHQPDEYLAMDRVKPMQDIMRELVNHLCI